MLFDIKNRSPESWGPLASVAEHRFNQILNNRKGSTKEMIKNEAKRAKRLKTYKVTFNKEWRSDSFQLQAENEYELSGIAAKFFEDNFDKIGFKERPRSQWAGEYKGYDTISYVKVKSTANK